MNCVQKEQSENKVVFEVNGITSVYANTLRRLMLGEIPTLAIEDVSFKQNDSVLYDEIIAHRLGLVVFKTDLDSYNMMSTCPCKGAGCPQCQVEMSLSVKGPKTVYAKDLVCKDPSVVPAQPNTIIVKLAENQVLDIFATAQLGLGKEHAKWSPGLVWYYNKPRIKVNNKSKDLADCKDKYPPQIFNDKGEIDTKKINTPSLIDACIDVSDAVHVEFEPDTFVFTIESFGALPAQDIIRRAVKTFDKQIAHVESLVKEL
ncbi:MAG: DNA-directed RNA polymerase subunit D [Candidatus Woesearchaeota archaeon]